MTTPDPSRAAFEQWTHEYCLASEPNYSKGTEADCRAAHHAGWQAAMAHMQAEGGGPITPKKSPQTRMDACSDHGHNQGWQPIETAPKDGTKFLAYRPLAHLTHDPQIKVVKGTPHNYGCWEATVPPGYSLENFTDGACRATHWQPLPTAPKQEGST